MQSKFKKGGVVASEQSSDFSMRPMSLTDVETITEWSLNFDDAALFERNLPVPVGPEHIKDSWKAALEFNNPPRSLWYVAENAEGKPVGMCGLESINYIHGDAIIPVFVEKNYRSKGLAIRMSFSVIDLAFDTLRLHRLTTHYRVDHPISPALTSKAGFKEEGRVRGAWFSNGVHKDIVHVGLLKSDWLNVRDKLREELAASGRPAIPFRTNFD